MTDEEKYLIGVDFKNNKDKYKELFNTKNPSWDFLNIHYSMPFPTGEKWRKWTQRKQDKDGTLKKIDTVTIKDTPKSKEVESLPNYKSTTEFKTNGEQISDKLISMSENESKDPNFVLKSHGYDSSVFELISAKNSIWNMNTKEDGIKTLYASKISVKVRKEYSWNEEDTQKIFANLKTNVNKINIEPLQYKENGKLLVVALADFHYNLLSEQFSTGNEYNLEIAEFVYYYILNDVINRVKDKHFEKVLFVVGNDFVNADNLNGTTNHGTPQDNCSNWFNIIPKVAQLIVDGIDALTKIAPVDVVYVPSNHDLQTMFGIMQTINAHYRKDEKVSIDTSPLPRKYYKFGNTLLALSHDIKIKDALQIITSEAKDMWSGCEHVICLLAHMHQSMVYERQGYLEIMRLPCCSGFSRWSNDKGYIQTEKKNQSFIIDEVNGIEDIMNTVIK